MDRIFFECYFKSLFFLFCCYCIIIKFDNGWFKIVNGYFRIKENINIFEVILGDVEYDIKFDLGE